MSKVFIEESTLTSIGNAIRGKTGKSELISPLNMPTEIGGIQSGGNFDFSKLEYVQLTNSNGGSDLPDLTPFISDFNKVVCIMIQGNSSFYVYLKGTDTDRSSYKDMFYYNINYRSYTTPSTGFSTNGCHGLNITNLKKPEIIYLHSNSVLTSPWYGGFIMYYEGG